MTSNISMRLAAQSSATSIDACVAILKGITNEEAIAVQRYEFIVGRVMSNKLGDNAAIDYLPAIDAKPMQKGKWLPFPVNEPGTFDAAKHRPLDVHNRYRAALTAWSEVRKSAGLPSLATPRVARVKDGEETETAPKVTPSGLAVETGLDTAAIVSHVQAFENWLERTLKANAKQIRGDAGSILSDVEKTLRAHMVKLTNALASDAVPAPTSAEAKRAAELKASNDALVKELAALKASMVAPVTAPADVAVDEATKANKRARAKLDKLAKAA